MNLSRRIKPGESLSKSYDIPLLWLFSSFVLLIAPNSGFWIKVFVFTMSELFLFAINTIDAFLGSTSGNYSGFAILLVTGLRAWSFFIFVGSVLHSSSYFCNKVVSLIVSPIWIRELFWQSGIWGHQIKINIIYLNYNFHPLQSKVKKRKKISERLFYGQKNILKLLVQIYAVVYLLLRFFTRRT